ncbi:YbaK/EbsC family protein [Nonomuraea sp. NPDC059194]|uniref:YbaK/EbsC family protein n=1 Tax=Nonomuraea sp. NPDC059194 TaxID=3346764 RepID=UPI0036C764B1
MTLHWVPALDRLDLLAEPVALAVRQMEEEVRVAEIDPDLADTAAFCDRYGVAMDASANCVVVAGRRGGEVRYAACMVLATTRADVNGVVRRHIDARKTSFAAMDDAVALTGMEYGGITPLGLPDDWPILVDSRVAAHPEVVIGSGVRRSKLAVSGATLAALKTAEVLDLAN